MRRMTLIGVAFIALLLPSLSEAGTKMKYTELYYTAKNHYNADVGRNIRRDGIRDGVEATHNDYEKSLQVLRRFTASVVSAPTSVPAEGNGNNSSDGSGGGTPPESIAQCESGGSYTAVNPSSGARGKWQLLPSTYAANGGDGSWSPADQDRVAARVWAGGAGSNQWVCK